MMKPKTDCVLIRECPFYFSDTVHTDTAKLLQDSLIYAFKGSDVPKLNFRCLSQ